jgi:hypothetical protein
VCYTTLAHNLLRGSRNVLQGHVRDEIGVARIAVIDEASMSHQRAEI